MASSASRAASIEEVKARGNDRFAKGDLAGAAKLYKQALQQGGAVHLLQSNLSAIYLQGRMLAAALDAADAAIAANPSWPKGHFRRGSVLAALGGLRSQIHTAAPTRAPSPTPPSPSSNPVPGPHPDPA